MKVLIEKFENLKVHWFDVLIVVVLSTLISFLRVREQMPQLYPDEFLYVSSIRNDSLSELPNYFYTFLYSPINYCSDAFYTCAKGINVFLFGILLVLSFLIARKLVLNSYALLFVLFLGIGPLSGYSTLLTPEMLFFVITFLIFVIFLYFDSNSILFWTVLATLNALLLLTKPHGIFITIGLIGYLLFRGMQDKTLGRGSLFGIVFGLTTYSLVVVVRFLLGGGFSFNPLGNRYSGALVESGQTLTLGSSTLDPSYFHPFNLMSSFFQQIASHLSYSLALVGVGFLLYLVQVFRTSVSDRNDLELVFIFTFGALLLGIALFSAVGVFWGEMLQLRLMPRYYEHVALLAPLFYLRRIEANKKWLHLSFSLLIALILLLIEDKFYIFSFDSYMLGNWVLLGLPLVLLAIPTILVGLLQFKSLELAKSASVISLAVVVLLFNINYQMTLSRFTTKSQFVVDTFTLRDYLHELGDPRVLIVSNDINEFNRLKFWIPQRNVDYNRIAKLDENLIKQYSNDYDEIVVLESTEIVTEVVLVSKYESLSVISVS